MYTVLLGIILIIVGAFAITVIVTKSGLVGGCRVAELFPAVLLQSLVLAVVCGGLSIFYIPRPQIPPYTGEWKATIHWYNEFARTLLNYKGADPAFEPVNPRSEGSFYIYISESTGVYSGFSQWELKNGEKTYAQLVVIPGEFEFDSSEKLKSIEMATGFRTKQFEFDYAPFTRYRMEFYRVSEYRMRGKMIVYWNGEEIEVGCVTLEKH